MENDKVHKGKVVADRFEVSLRTLEGWRQKGVGPKWVKLGGAVRYRESDLQEWLREQGRR